MKKASASTSLIFTILGLILIVGGALEVGGQSLSVVNTLAISSPSYSCSLSGTCTVSATFTNNNYTLGSQIYVWGTIKNSLGRQLLPVQNQALNTPAGSSQPITFTFTGLAPGSYAVQLFGVANNIPLSNAVSLTINTGTVQISIATQQSSFTVTPIPISNTGTPSGNNLVYPSGTVVSVTYTNSDPTQILTCAGGQIYISGTVCVIQGANEILTFTAGSACPTGLGCLIAPLIQPAPNQYWIPVSFVLVNPSTVSVILSPGGQVKLYPSSAGSSYPTTTTQTITYSAGAGLTGQGAAWVAINGQGTKTILNANATSITITEAQLSALEPVNDPFIAFTVEVDASATVQSLPSLLVVPINGGLYTGAATESPVPGTYYEKLGSIQTVTLANAGSLCSVSWMIDGQLKNGLGLSASVQMTTSHTVGPIVQGCGQITIQPTTGLTFSPAPGTYTPANSSKFTVTETTQTGYCFIGWNVNGISKGTGSSITVTENGQAQAIGGAAVPVQTINGAGGSSCTAQAAFTISGGTIYPGTISLLPAAGTYPENFGSSVTVAAVVNPGYCWAGWYLNGAYYSPNLIVTVTMPSAAGQGNPVLTATDAPAPANGQCTSPGPAPGAGLSSSISTGIGLLLVGFASAGFGLYTKRGKLL